MRDYDLPFKCGAVIDDSSAGARAANDLAFPKMLAGQSPASSSEGAEVKLPDGRFYFGAGLVTAKAGILAGAGGAQRNSATWLIFPAGVTGILAGNINNNANNTQSTGLHIRDLAIASDYNGFHVAPGNYSPLWEPDTVTAVGTIRNTSFLPVDDAVTIGNSGYPAPHPGMCYGYAIQCIAVTGDAKTAATRDLEPENENIYPLRNSAVSAMSGNGVNPIEITSNIIKPNGLSVMTGHRLITGMYVRISGVVGNTAANGIHQVTVVDADTFTIPVSGNGAYVSGGYVERVIRDDNVYWLPIEAHGIDAKAKVTLENVYCTGFPGNGKNFNCSVNHPYYANANLSRIMGGDDEQNGGGGIVIMGGDTALITMVGTNTNQNRGVGYDVKGGSTCLLVDPHGAINVQGDYRIWDSTALTPYSEGSYRPCVVVGTGNSQWIGGVPGGNQDLQFSGHYASGADPVTWAGAVVVTLGQYVKPPVDNGYVYKVTQAGTLAAPPAFIPRGFADLEIGGDFKEVTSGTAKLVPFAQSILSIGEIAVGTTRNSAKAYINKMGARKFECFVGFTGETAGPTDYGPIGIRAAGIDGGQTWGLEVDGTRGWLWKRAHGTGALGMTFGADPRSYSPHGHIFLDVPAEPPAPDSGYVVYSIAGVLKKKSAAGVVTNL